MISFAGDAITCWLDGDTGLRATACALAMQETMQQFAAVEISFDRIISLAMKVEAMDAGQAMPLDEAVDYALAYDLLI